MTPPGRNRPPPSEREADGLMQNPGWREGNLWPLVIGGEKIGPAGVQQVSRLYERGGEYTDFQIGRLLAALHREGLLQGTAVLVTADHGEELHDHGYWSHGSTLYQEVLHVPMILRLPEPGSEAGSVVHTPVSLVDVAPTLTAIAGLPDGDGWSDGLNMLRLPEARTLFSITTAHAPLRFSITRPPWKYIYFNRGAFEDTPPKTAQGRWLKSHGQPTELLFNLEEDPGERQNLIGRAPEVAAEMHGMMEAWFAEAIDEDELERLHALGYVQ